MVDPSRLDSVRRQARDGVEAVEEAEARLKEMMGADRVSITVKPEKTSAHITWKSEDNDD